MNKYLDWIEKQAGLQKEASALSALGKGALDLGKDIVKAPINYLGKTVSQASGKEFREFVNTTALSGKGSAAKLQQFSANKHGYSNLKNLLRDSKKRHKWATGEDWKVHNKETMSKARDLIVKSRNAKIKLGLIGAGGLYATKKMADRGTAPKQPDYSQYY